MTKKRKIRILGPVCPEHGAAIQTDNGHLGSLIPIKEGESLNGREMVQIGERNEDGSYDMTTVVEGHASRMEEADEVEVESAPAPTRTGKGPAQYATKASRETWDRVFGKNKKSAAN